MKNNKSYRKILVNGIVQNPITKEKPFLVSESTKGMKKIRKTNNGSGIRLFISKIGVYSFAKYKQYNQITTNGLIVHRITS